MARKRKGQAVNGWVCFDKPLGMGSTQAVGKLRWLYDAQKAGHAGTLDPLATGILPIALGEATKTGSFMTDAAKSYRFTAASGEAVELAPRPVRIDALRLVEVEPDAATFEVDCGKGTYVRSLARDLAAALGACGHVSVLRRTRVGSFTEASAISLETLEDLRHKARALEGLLPVETALDDIPALAITEDDALLLVQGRSIVLLPRDVETLSARLSGDARTVSAMANGRLTALCEMRAGRLNPVRVFNLT